MTASVILGACLPQKPPASTARPNPYLCRGPGDDACGHVEEALAPQERRQGFVPDDAAAR